MKFDRVGAHQPRIREFASSEIGAKGGHVLARGETLVVTHKSCPGGTTENSPPVHRWVGDGENRKAESRRDD